MDHLVAGRKVNSPAAGKCAVVSALVRGGVLLPAQSSVRPARLAGATDGAIGVVANPCPDCRFYPGRHLRATADKDNGWTADHVALL